MSAQDDTEDKAHVDAGGAERQDEEELTLPAQILRCARDQHRSQNAEYEGSWEGKQVEDLCRGDLPLLPSTPETPSLSGCAV